jgi:hypothetical protein
METPMNWLVVSPAWGERCVGLFVDKVLPAVRAAADRSSSVIRFLVHTGDPKQIKQAIKRAFAGAVPRHAHALFRRLR